MNPAAAQSAASDPTVSAFVTANAGSGKTKTLVDRVSRILLQGVRPSALLCVTYTKAAAAEMQSRLFGQLGDWAVCDDARLREALAALEDRPAASFDQADLSRARRLFARALETPGGLKIQTIHAFCEALLRRFPLEAGVSPRFEVAEEALAAALAREAREAVAHSAAADPEGPLGRAYAHFAIELDYAAFEETFLAFDAKREAIAAYLAQAEAAGGVEADVWRRCEAGEPVDPEQAADAAVRPPVLDAELWRGAAEALVRSGGSRDAACAEQLRRVAELTEAGEPAWEAVLDALFTAVNGKWKGQGPARAWIADSKALASSGVREAFLAEQARIEAARDLYRRGRTARDTVHALRLAATYGAAYAAAKRRHAALDFADLIDAARRLLTEKADAAWVLYKLDGGVDHVLVDEAQDTAPAQWDIVEALTAEFFAGAGLWSAEGPARTVFAVGDEKQSIYSFQGARPERLLAEAQAYDTRVRGAGGVFKGPILAESWRSTDEVLTFVDTVFADPETRAGVPPPAGEDIVRHLPQRAQHGCVDLWTPFRDEPRTEPEAWDAPVDAEAAGSARKRLVRRIATEITDACAHGDRVWDKQARAWRPARPGDFLILVRRRDALFEEVLRALKRAGLPVSGADRLKLSSHGAVQDLLSLARFALFPEDDLTLAVLLRSPFCDVDEAGLFELAHTRESLPLWAALGRRSAERPEWAAAHAFLTGVIELARGSAPFDFFARLLATTDGQGRSMRRRMLQRLGGEAGDAADAFLAEVLTLERRGPASLEAVVAAMEQAEVEVKRELDEAQGEVRVMTVHGAKGLEAPVVILPDTTARAKPHIRERLFPGEDGGFFWCGRKAEDCAAGARARAWSGRKQDEESLRLFYVALTRARDRLIVCGRTPGNVGKKPAEDGSWWTRARAAFDRPEIQARGLGDPEGLRFGPDPEPAHAAEAESGSGHRLPEWVGRAPAPDPNVRPVSPSGGVAAGAAPSPLAARNGLGRFRRGELIHKLLELLPDLSPAERPHAASAFLAKQPGLNEEQRAEMAAAALAVLADPAFAAVFGPGSRAEAAVAGQAPGLPPISGRVDRLLVEPGRVLVVDFKTNRPPPERIEDADPAYLDQMAIYTAVLRAVFPDRPVQAALLWTDGPHLMAVPAAVVEERLAILRAD